ncbi:MAG: type II 3-dehydroquinate dehydratase [Candidatus Dormibacteria bacterium]
MNRVLVLNGPNLNLLGGREPEVYGAQTLAQLEEQVHVHARKLSLEVRCRQSNSEGALIDEIHEARAWADAILINPGGYSHTSVAIRDALVGVGLLAIEVHLSNPYAREEFRHVDLVAGGCAAVVCGFGVAGYLMALDQVAARSAKAVPGSPDP